MSASARIASRAPLGDMRNQSLSMSDSIASGEIERSSGSGSSWRSSKNIPTHGQPTVRKPPKTPARMLNSPAVRLQPTDKHVSVGASIVRRNSQVPSDSSIITTRSEKDVSQAIMELREKRQQAQTRRVRREHQQQQLEQQQPPAPPPRRQLSRTNSKTTDSRMTQQHQEEDPPGSPHSSVFSSLDSTVEPSKSFPLQEKTSAINFNPAQTQHASEEDEVRARAYKAQAFEANVRLKSTQEQMSAMARELDELRFFHEIDATDGSKVVSPKKKEETKPLTAWQRHQQLVGQVKELTRRNEKLQTEKEALQASVERSTAIQEDNAQHKRLLEEELRQLKENIVPEMLEQEHTKLRQEHSAELERVRKKHEEEVEAVRQQITREYESKLNRVRTQKSELENQRQHLELELVEVREDSRLLHESGEREWKAHEEKLREELEEARQQNDTAHVCLMEKESELENLRADLEASREREDELSNREEEYKNKLSEVIGDLTRLEEKHAKTLEESMHRQKALEDLKEENEKQWQEKEKNLHEEAEELGNLVSSAETALSENAALVEHLQIRLQRTEAHNAELKEQQSELRNQSKEAELKLGNELSQKEEKLSSLRQENEKKLAECHAELEQLKIQLDERNEASEKAVEQVKHLEALHEEAWKNLEREQELHKSKEAELERKLKDLEEKANMADSVNQERVTEVDSLKEELKQARNDSSSLELKMKHRIHVLEVELRAASEERTKEKEFLEGKLAETSTSLGEQEQQLRDQIVILEKDLRTANDERTKAVEAFEEKLAKLRDESSEIEQKLKEQLQVVEEEVRTSNELLAQERLGKDKTNSLISILESQLENAKTNNEGKVSELNSQVHELKLSLVAFESKTTQQAARIRELTKEVEDASSKHQDAQKSLSLESEELVQSLVAKHKQEMDSVSAKNASMIEELKAELEVKSKSLGTLQEDLKKAQGDLQRSLELSSSRAVASDKLSKRIAELEATKVSTESVQAEVEKLRSLHERVVEAEASEAETRELYDSALADLDESDRALKTLMSELMTKNDKIETLALELEDKDEELTNAKLIATTALAKLDNVQSQEHDERSVEHAEQIHGTYEEKMNEMNASMNYLRNRVDELHRTNTDLASELKESRAECHRLESALHRSHHASSPAETSTFSSLTSEADWMVSDKYQSFDENPEKHAMVLVESPISKLASNHDETLESLRSSNNGNAFVSSFEDTLTDSGESSSDHSFEQRRLEKDALKKYMVHRFKSQQEESGLAEI